MKRHVFVVVGFGASRSAPGLAVPFQVTVSNCVAADGNLLAQAESTFRTRPVVVPPGNNFGVTPAGQRPPQAVAARMVRRLINAHARGVGSGAIARIIADAVRETAATNPAVGRGLLVSIIPRGAMRDSQTVLSLHVPLAPSDSADYFNSVFPDDQMTHLYLPADASSPVVHGPLYASPGIMVKGFTMGPEQ